MLINQRVAAEVAGLVARHRHGVEDGRDAVRAAERASAERVAQLRAQAARDRQDLPPLGSGRPGKPPGSAENGVESGSAAGRASAELSRHVPGRAAPEPGGWMYRRASVEPGERSGRARDSGAPPGSEWAGNPVLRGENGADLDEDFSGRSWLR